MSALQFTFDRLTYIDRLTAAGFDERQARAHAEALDAALRESVATKGDVHEVRQELKQDIGDLRQELKQDIADLRQELKQDIEDVRRDMRQMETRLDAKIETSGANLKVDILRWLIVTQLALAGFVFAAIKFVK